VTAKNYAWLFIKGIEKLRLHFIRSEQLRIQVVLRHCLSDRVFFYHLQEVFFVEAELENALQDPHFLAKLNSSFISTCSISHELEVLELEGNL